MILARSRRSLSLLTLTLTLTLALLGCPSSPEPGAERNGAHEATPSSSTSSPSRAPSPGDAPEFVLAPAAGDVVELVVAERRRASAAGRTLLVYVGASWCEPCQYFHAAVDEGEFDQDLANVRLLEFDLDQDRDRLVAAGYQSRMIPLFVVPGPDGRAGPRRTEGGIKGPATVEHLRGRLVALVRAARADQG